MRAVGGVGKKVVAGQENRLCQGPKVGRARLSRGGERRWEAEAWGLKEESGMGRGRLAGGRQMPGDGLSLAQHSS